MSFTRRVEKILEVRNKEKILSAILKNERQRLLESVSLEDEDLLLTFSDNKNYAMKMVVKQYSKKKYKDKNEFLSKFLRSKCYKFMPGCTVWKVVGVIELPEVWLAFFKRNWNND